MPLIQRFIDHERIERIVRLLKSHANDFNEATSKTKQLQAEIEVYYQLGKLSICYDNANLNYTRKAGKSIMKNLYFGDNDGEMANIRLN